MAEGTVNRVWMSVDVGSYSQGQKVSFFAGGDTPQEVLSHFGEVFGTATDQAIARLTEVLATDPTAAAIGNLQAAGMVGNNTAADPNAPLCNHGARTKVTGKSAKGPWSAWMCPQPKGAPDKCDPIWI